MQKNVAQQAKTILRNIDECEKAIDGIKRIQTQDICIGGADTYIRVPVLYETKEQIKEIAIDAYKRKIKELENELYRL